MLSVNLSRPTAGSRKYPAKNSTPTGCSHRESPPDGDA